MSRVSYRKNDLEIVCGWDRPLNGYHLTIYRDEEDFPIYCNEEDESLPDIVSDNVDYYRSVLTRFNISVPEKFWELSSKKLGNEVFKVTDEDK